MVPKSQVFPLFIKWRRVQALVGSLVDHLAMHLRLMMLRYGFGNWRCYVAWLLEFGAIEVAFHYSTGLRLNRKLVYVDAIWGMHTALFSLPACTSWWCSFAWHLQGLCLSWPSRNMYAHCPQTYWAHVYIHCAYVFITLWQWGNTKLHIKRNPATIIDWWIFQFHVSVCAIVQN